MILNIQGHLAEVLSIQKDVIGSLRLLPMQASKNQQSHRIEITEGREEKVIGFQQSL
jgi:hypothetical protein